MTGSTIPEKLYPKHIDYLRAKSDDRGGDTLAQHTWDVLSRLRDQYILRPNLTETAGDSRLWQRLYWGCFLHDFGKAALGFQERLKDTKIDNAWRRGEHRHEILSLGFVDWLFPQGHPDRLAVICVIVCHHKDADWLIEKYGAIDRPADQQGRIEFLISQLESDVVDDLWLWLENYGLAWQQALGLPILEEIHPINRSAFGVGSIYRALDEFKTHLILHEDGDLSIQAVLADVHYRGLIFTADHAASAGADPFPLLELTPEIAGKPLEGKEHRYHQTQASKAGEGSLIMIAPTGSGKTEAALMWAARQIELRPASRLFYTLPYQASMNAMEKRLKEKFFEGKPDNQVTIQHSRATLKFYQEMMDADSGADPRAAAKTAKQRKNLAELHYYPVQVFSPYQMLKAAYSLKGYEALLVDYTGALFIFDEIHAYEPRRLALIITMMDWLAEHYRAHFLVMTATLPPTVRDALHAALPGCAEILADDKTFTESRRHTVDILDGDLQDNLHRVHQDFNKGNAVLVCCNQVKRAQAVYKALQAKPYNFTTDSMMLLHGRFNGKDRGKKEAQLADLVGTGTKDRKPYVIVATQVVEVSLDIDLDTIYTDPAPLDALLQRFGRVNRGRGKDAPLCPVHVFTQPMGETESLPYDFNLVDESVRVLTEHCQNGAIDEKQVTVMLEEIYQHEDIRTSWEQDYRQSAREFAGVLNRMRPFESATPETYRDFYKLFDGVQVLPVDCEDDYYNALDRGGYLAASEYLVNVSWAQFGRMKSKDLVIGREEDEYADHVNIPYNDEWGLDIEGALNREDDEP